MTDILKPGETGWFRRRDGKITYAFRVLIECKFPIKCFTKDAIFCMPASGVYLVSSQHSIDLVERLPDCTGFDWKPEKKYIPWDIHTMPDSVKVRLKGNKFIWVARPLSEKHVDLPGMSCTTYLQLFNEYEQLDGTPCGRLSDG